MTAHEFKASGIHYIHDLQFIPTFHGRAYSEATSLQ